jgi:hypothetical protein
VAIDFTWVDECEEFSCVFCGWEGCGEDLKVEFVQPSLTCFGENRGHTGYEYFCPDCDSLITTRYWNMYG